MAPKIIYGTAWKKNQTKELVRTALEKGFRAIDTANQPRHYNESLVGEAIMAWYKTGNQREDLFIQTKFTPTDGQDHRIPFNPNAPLHVQVKESFQSSLKHLQTDYLDAYLLHGPYSRFEWTQQDWIVWRSLEDLHTKGLVKRIGVSNVHLGHLKTLWEDATIKPEIVQNRCYAQLGWDRDVRAFCMEHTISYQGFSLLTANPFVLNHTTVRNLASNYGISSAQVIFIFARQAGMTPLTGTTSPEHMVQDLSALDLKIKEEERDTIRDLVCS